mgnify:CR=1 FL=1
MEIDLEDVRSLIIGVLVASIVAGLAVVGLGTRRRAERNQ